MSKLSDKQRKALAIIKDGGCIRWYCSPGAEHGGWFFEAQSHNEDLDGRVAVSLEKRGFIRHDGSGCYPITKAGLDALAAS